MSHLKYLPKKFDPVPKRHHFYLTFIFLCGMLLPPIAVAARFGIGKDFFINCILTICGYFPGHGHNFYLQNIRNNENKARTPKWARKAGLVDPADEQRRIAKSQWTKRYAERNNVSTHVGAELEEGESGGNYMPVDPREEERIARLRNEGLWRGEDESYYNEDQAPNQRHKHYPMNFEGTNVNPDLNPFHHNQSSDRQQKGERDPITGALIGGSAYSDSGPSSGTYPHAASADDDVPEWGKDYGSRGKASSKKSKNPLKRNKKSGEGMGVQYNDQQAGGMGGGGTAGGYGRGGYDDFDERPARGSSGGYGGAGSYGGSGNTSGGRVAGGQSQGQAVKKKTNDPFEHEF